jgi:ABC-2 type transport system permease protein
MFAIFKKELKAYFLTPAGYIFMGFSLLMSGFFFMIINLLPGSSDYNALLGNNTFLFMLVVPILTMRLISEESKQKTDQLLFTSPVKITAIVLGKYLAALGIFLITLLVTCIYPFMLASGGFIAVAQIIGGYLGFFLLGACFIAIGLFISALTENQIVAAVVTFSVLLFIWVLDAIRQVMPNSTTSGIIFAVLILIGVCLFVYFTTKQRFLTIAVALIGLIIITSLYFMDKTLYQGIIQRFLEWFSLLKRYESFSKGNLNLSSFIYYLSFAIAFIFLTIQKIENRRFS